MGLHQSGAGTSLGNKSNPFPEAASVNIPGLMVEFLSRAGPWLRKVLPSHEQRAPMADSR